MTIPILTICIALNTIRLIEGQTDQKFHHAFSKMGESDLNFQPVSVNRGEDINIYYFNDETDGSYKVWTNSSAAFSVQKAKFIGKIHPTFIFVDNQNASKLATNNNTIVVVFFQTNSIQTSQDGGQNWDSNCKSCLAITWPGNPNPGFDSYRTAVYVSKVNAWISFIDYKKITYIMAARNVKNWVVGSNATDTRVLEILGLIEIAELDAPNNVQDFVIVYVINLSQVLCIEIVITLDGNGVPKATYNKINGNITMDYGDDLYYLIPVSDGVDVKTSKILYPFFPNYYIKYNTNSIDWTYTTGTPRTVTFKTVDGKVKFNQMPYFIRKTGTWYRYSYPTLKLHPDINPFDCFEMATFVVAFDIDPNTTNQAFVRFRADAGYKVYTEVGYEQSVGFYIDRRKTGLPNNFDNVKENFIDDAYFERRAVTANGKSAALSILALVDYFSVEMFCNKGAIVLSAVIFPDPDNLKIVISGQRNSRVQNVSFERILVA